MWLLVPQTRGANAGQGWLQASGHSEQKTFEGSSQPSSDALVGPALHRALGGLDKVWQMGICWLIPIQDRELGPEELEGEYRSLLRGGGRWL